MAKRRKGRKTVRRDPPTAPTPETKAKLTPDPIFWLAHVGYECGGVRRYLDSDAERAAEEIKNVYFAIVRGQLAGIGRYGEYVQGHYDMDPTLAAAYSQRYKPWANAQGRKVELVIDVVVDRMDIESEAAMSAVARALDSYARMMRTPLDIDCAVG